MYTFDLNTERLKVGWLVTWLLFIFLGREVATNVARRGSNCCWRMESEVLHVDELYFREAVGIVTTYSACRLSDRSGLIRRADWSMCMNRGFLTVVLSDYLRFLLLGRKRGAARSTWRSAWRRWVVRILASIAVPAVTLLEMFPDCCSIYFWRRCNSINLSMLFWRSFICFKYLVYSMNVIPAFIAGMIECSADILPWVISIVLIKKVL